MNMILKNLYLDNIFKYINIIFNSIIMKFIQKNNSILDFVDDDEYFDENNDNNNGLDEIEFIYDCMQCDYYKLIPYEGYSCLYENDFFTCRVGELENKSITLQLTKEEYNELQSLKKGYSYDKNN